MANQLRGIWAPDLLVVQTVSFRTLYVFFLIEHERRRLLHFNVTASPALPDLAPVRGGDALGPAAKYLIHDRDAVYGGDFDRKLASLGIVGVRTRHGRRMPTPWPSGLCGGFGPSASTT